MPLSDAPDTARRLLFATTNPGKRREVEAVLAPHGIEVIGLDDLAMTLPEPEEDGATFEANARIKARAYARDSGMRCLGEDSGLVVDALFGAPGVHSARYAGTTGSRQARDEANNQRLLRELEGLPGAPRSARFVCAMCLCEPGGEILAETKGTFEGVIAEAPKGENGFGYDPLLFLPDVGMTAAELAPEEKNARSHRGAATRALLEHAFGLLHST